MTGSRKFALEYMTRNDLTALTRDAADRSGIQFITEADVKEVEEILNS